MLNTPSLMDNPGTSVPQWQIILDFNAAGADGDGNGVRAITVTPAKLQSNHHQHHPNFVFFYM